MKKLIVSAIAVVMGILPALSGNYLLVRAEKDSAQYKVTEVESLSAVVREPSLLVFHKIGPDERYISESLVTCGVWQRVLGVYPASRSPFCVDGYLPGQAPERPEKLVTDISWEDVHDKFLPAFNERLSSSGWQVEIPSVSDVMTYLKIDSCEKRPEIDTWTILPEERYKGAGGRKTPVPKIPANSRDYWEWTSDEGMIPGTEDNPIGPGIPAAKAHYVVYDQVPSSGKLLFKVGYPQYTGGTLGVRLILSRR